MRERAISSVCRCLRTALRIGAAKREVARVIGIANTAGHQTPRTEFIAITTDINWLAVFVNHTYCATTTITGEANVADHTAGNELSSCTSRTIVSAITSDPCRGTSLVTVKKTIVLSFSRPRHQENQQPSPFEDLPDSLTPEEFSGELLHCRSRLSWHTKPHFRTQRLCPTRSRGPTPVLAAHNQLQQRGTGKIQRFELCQSDLS